MPPKKKRANRKRNNLFYATFIGEHVQLTGEFSFPTLDGTMTSIQGFLLDVDGDYLYLGLTPDEVYMAVERDKLFSINIVIKKDIYQEILENVATPEDRKLGN